MAEGKAPAVGEILRRLMVRSAGDLAGARQLGIKEQRLAKCRPLGRVGALGQPLGAGGQRGQFLPGAVAHDGGLGPLRYWLLVDGPQTASALRLPGTGFGAGG